MVCLRAVSDGMTEWLVSNVDTLILIRTYNFRTAYKIFPAITQFRLSENWQYLMYPWGSTESSLSNNSINEP